MKLFARQTIQRTRAAAAFSLLETVVSMTVFTVLAGTVLTTLITTQRANGTVAANLDQDQNARKVLSLLRGELKQSGWEGRTDDEYILTPDSGQTTSNLVFQKRIGHGSEPQNSANDWGTSISYQLAADGVFKNVPGSIVKYRLTRTQDGVTTGIASNLESISFERIDDLTVGIVIVFLKPNPAWTGSSAPEPLRLRVRELVRMRNRRAG